MRSNIFNLTIFLFSIILISFPRVTFAQQNNPNFMSPIDSDAFMVMKDFFEYDKGIPLEATMVERVEDSSFTREKIVFTGIGNTRVPGYLGIPAQGDGPFKCVLLIHGVGDSKESWWTPNSFSSGRLLTQSLIDSGFAVLSLDAQYHGERMMDNDYESADVFIFQKGWILRARDMIVQSVIEYRRAMDYLASRKEIDTAGFGVVGYSMGGMMVFNLAAVDSRLTAAVASVSPVLKEPYSALAAYNFAPFIERTAFLMLLGESDNRNYSKAEGNELYNLIKSNKKEVKWYNSGHKLPEEWTNDASKWLAQYLK